MAEFLEFEDVSKHYGAGEGRGRRVAVDPQGEFFSLLGPSGCGKTTLLRILAGFEQPDTGRVLLDGEDITDLPPNERKVNTIFQSYALFPHLTVRENIAFGLKVAKRPDRRDRAPRSTKMLTLIQMEDQACKKPGPDQRRAEAARGHRARADQQAAACCCSTSRWPRSTSSCASAC